MKNLKKKIILSNYTKKYDGFKLEYVGDFKVPGFIKNPNQVRMKDKDYLKCEQILEQIKAKSKTVRHKKYERFFWNKAKIKFKDSSIKKPIIFKEDDNLRFIKYINIRQNTIELLGSNQNIIKTLLIDYFNKHHDFKKIHGAAISINKKGIILLGDSKAGKSLICKNLNNKPNTIVFGDDKTICVNIKNKYKILKLPSNIFYRTPHRKKKKILKNEKAYYLFRKYRSKKDFLINLDYIFVLKNKIKGKSKFSESNHTNCAKLIKEATAEAHLLDHFSNKKQNLPVINVELGSNLKHLYEELLYKLNKIK